MIVKMKLDKSWDHGPTLLLCCLCFLLRVDESSTSISSDIEISENCTTETLWPTNPKGETLVLAFLMTQLGKSSEKLGLKIKGMMSYAIEFVNKNQILPENYTLQVEIHDTEGDEVKILKDVTDVLGRNISVIIGPESSCWVGASIAEAHNMPMISYACTDNRASRSKTFARTNPSEIHILNATLETLVHFNWRKFSIIYEDFPSYVSMVKTLTEEAIKRKMTINHIEPFKSSNHFQDIFGKTKAETRIYVLIAHHSMVSRVLLAMTLSGLLKRNMREYFLIHVDTEEFIHRNWDKYIFDSLTLAHLMETKKCLTNDLEAFENSFIVIANRLLTNNNSIANITREYNRKEPFCNRALVSISLFQQNKGTNNHPPMAQHVPLLPAAHLFDAVILYANAVKRIYEERINTKSNKSINVKDIGRDGIAIAEQMKDITFTSILGYDVNMGSDRASTGRYSVYYFQKAAECQEPKHLSELKCTTHCLIELYDTHENTMSNQTIIKVLDMPVCGYNGELCPKEEKIDVKRIVLITLGTAVSILIFFSLLQYRHWKYEQKISVEHHDHLDLLPAESSDIELRSLIQIT